MAEETPGCRRDINWHRRPGGHLARSILDQPSLATPEGGGDRLSGGGGRRCIRSRGLFNALAYAAREMLRHEEASTYAASAPSARPARRTARGEARARVGQARDDRPERGDVVAARADLDRARRLGHLDATIALAGAVLAEKAGTSSPRRPARGPHHARGPRRRRPAKALNNLASCVMDSDPERALGLLAQAARLVPCRDGDVRTLIQLNPRSRAGDRRPCRRRCDHRGVGG